MFGGSFDPVHCGHLAAARSAADHLRLDQVRFVPARLQPLKASGPRAGSQDRLAMLRAALDGAQDFVVDPREIGRPGPSYTVDTLREITRERPADELFLLIGADAVQDLPRWHDAPEIPKLATVVVLPRSGSGLPPGDGVIALEMTPVDVSATAIREALARRQSIKHLVPEVVADYIAAHGLYRTGV